MKYVNAGEYIGHMGGYAFWVFDSGEAYLDLFPFEESFLVVGSQTPAWFLQDTNRLPSFAPLADEVIRRQWYRELGISKDVAMSLRPPVAPKTSSAVKD